MNLPGSTKVLPPIIQGGMGVAVSSWRLARRVAELGQIGVVSGTAIDSVVVRELQKGDPHGRIRALRAYPDQEIVDHLVSEYFVDGGIDAETPFKLLPMHRPKPTVRSQRILCAAAFSEVFLARDGHNGIVGINLLAKIKRHSLGAMYGAMLAGVDAILIGAGIPIEEAEQIPKLAAGERAQIRLDVDMSQAPEGSATRYYELTPSDIVENPPVLPRPMFFPIVSSDLLARILQKKLPAELITGFIVESAPAGGHNAPPRGKGHDEAGNPVYDERDVVNLSKMTELGFPFYLAGSMASPDKLKEAREQGAVGIQVGSIFSLANESGYPAETKRRLITMIHEGRAVVRTDGRVSSTGFPFKVVEMEGTLGIPDNLAKRTRICDLGYLQQVYVDGNDRFGVRCPGEPVEAYVSKGGDEADAKGRGCLCNALMSNIGLGQVQSWGHEEQMFTAGDALVDLPLGSAEDPEYSAEDVIRYLLGD